MTEPVVYETSDGKYKFEDNGNHVSVYINGKLWGIPQGEMAIKSLLQDIIRAKGTDNLFYPEMLEAWGEKVIDQARKAEELADNAQDGSYKQGYRKGNAAGLIEATTHLHMFERKEKFRMRRLKNERTSSTDSQKTDSQIEG